MEAMRRSWTDERLDDLNARVDDLGRRMDAGFARVDAELRALDGRFDDLQRILIQIGFGFAAALMTLLAAMLGLIATQL